MSTTQHEVLIWGVRKYGVRGAKVHASVDGEFVMWDPARGGWDCKICGDVDLSNCTHIDAIEALLAPSVLGDWYHLAEA